MHWQRYGDQPRGVIWEICGERDLQWGFHRSQVHRREVMLMEERAIERTSRLWVP